MTTDVDICNRALVRLGSRTISALNEDSGDKSLACATLYEGIRLSCLTMRDWRFSVQKVQLARLVSEPVNEWQYAYQLPPNMIAGPLAVFDSTAVGVKPHDRFEVFGDVLYSDDAVVVIDFQQDVAEAQMPPWFHTLLELASAGAFAPIVTESTKIAIEYNERAFGPPSDNMRGGWFAICAQIDGKSAPAKQITDDTLVQARFS